MAARIEPSIHELPRVTSRFTDRSAKSTIAFVLNHRFYCVGGTYFGDLPNLMDLLLALRSKVDDLVLCVPTAVVDEPPYWTLPVPSAFSIQELPYYGSHVDLLLHSPLLTMRLVWRIVRSCRRWDAVGAVAPSGFGLFTVLLALAARRRVFLLIRGDVIASLQGENQGSVLRRTLVLAAMLPLDIITRALTKAGVRCFAFGPALVEKYSGRRVHALQGYARTEIASPPVPPLHDETRLAKVLYVGRLTGEKGVDILLHAIRALSDSGVTVQATIVGDGQARSTLTELAQDLEVAEQVTFRRYVKDSTQLRELYLEHGVVVLPSRTEGLPSVLLEAMALGRVVVASDVGGIPYLLNSGEDGVLVPSEDPDALAEAIRKLLASPAEAFRLAETALERSRTRSAESEASMILESVLGTE